MEKINFPYRSESHLPFLHVVGQSGSWEKHGLQVDYDKFISSADAHNNVERVCAVCRRQPPFA